MVVASIEITTGGNARLARRLGKVIENIPAQALFFHPPLVARAVEFALATPVILGALEQGQHIIPAPARIAGQLRPLVVIPRLTAHINHRVDGRAAAQTKATGVVDGATIEAGFRLGFVAPISAGIVDAKKVANRDMNPDPVVLAARFEQ